MSAVVAPIKVPRPPGGLTKAERFLREVARLYDQQVDYREAASLLKVKPAYAEAAFREVSRRRRNEALRAASARRAAVKAEAERKARERDRAAEEREKRARARAAQAQERVRQAQAREAAREKVRREKIERDALRQLRAEETAARKRERARLRAAARIERQRVDVQVAELAQMCAPDSATYSARGKAIIAARLHLVDLKRAGFCAGHGELRIGNADGVTIVARPTRELRSSIGSPSAMCLS